MTIDEFLYQSADALRNGDYLLPEVVLAAIDESRDSLEELGEKLESAGERRRNDQEGDCYEMSVHFNSGCPSGAGATELVRSNPA